MYEWDSKGNITRTIKAVDTISSVNTLNNCIMVYTTDDCKGKWLKDIKPDSGCHRNWLDSDCPGLNDKIRSISYCWYPD